MILAQIFNMENLWRFPQAGTSHLVMLMTRVFAGRIVGKHYIWGLRVATSMEQPCGRGRQMNIDVSLVLQASAVLGMFSLNCKTHT
jgi:hypothetical protein